MASIDPAIRRYEEALRVIALLEDEGHEARLAGGCVRDRLMGIAPKDYDVATTALPEKVLEICKKHGVKAVPTGIDHGTVTVVMPTGPVEVTTLRLDVATDGRRAVVEFHGKSFEEDAARRDFTINALFEDRSGKIYDFFGGQEHLRRRILAFVGDPKTRIQEDYLRILRFFRFWARFGFKPAEGTLDVIARQAPGLKRISQERITSEIWGLLGAAAPAAALRGMIDTGVFAQVFPELRVPDLEHMALDELRTHEEKFLPGMRLAALIVAGLIGDASGVATKPEIAAASRLMARMRLPNHVQSWIEALFVGWRELPVAAQDIAFTMELIDWVEERTEPGFFEHAFVPFWTHWCSRQQECAVYGKAVLLEVKRVEEGKGPLRRRPLPIDGKTVMQALGLGPGPEVGEALTLLRRAFRRGAWQTREEGLAWLKERWPKER